MSRQSQLTHQTIYKFYVSQSTALSEPLIRQEDYNIPLNDNPVFDTAINVYLERELELSKDQIHYGTYN